MSTPVTVYVPRDSAARSVGADEVADRIALAASEQGRDVTVVRNGSRGLLWLEPMVEVTTDRGRVAYGPVTPADVDRLVDEGLFDGADNGLSHGLTDEMEWLRDQHRITFARVGVIDPLSLDEYQQHGGLAGLRRALDLTPEQVTEEVTTSGLRGRGGAGFPAGIKWKTVMMAGADGGEQKYICCNADEGDSGTYADRMLMEGDPFTLIEGMLIAARARGRHHGLHLPPLGVPRRRRDVAHRDRDRLQPRCARVVGARLRPGVRPRGPGRRGCLHLRRGDLDAGEPRGQARGDPPEAADPGAVGSVRQADRRQQRDHPRVGARHPRRGWIVVRRSGRRALARHPGLPARRKHQARRHRRDGVRDQPRRPRQRLRRRHAHGSSGARRAGRWPARRLSPGGAVRPAARLRGVRRGRRDGRARRRGGLRRHRRHGSAGPVRDGVLRRGVLRQVHALPDRVGARRRGHRPDHRRPRTRQEPRASRRPVRDDGRRLVVRDGRADTDAGAQRHPALPGGLRQAGRDAAAACDGGAGRPARRAGAPTTTGASSISSTSTTSNAGDTATSTTEGPS